MDPDVERLRNRFAEAAGVQPSPGVAPDPLLDLVVERVPLPAGAVELLRPRDPDRLDFEPVGARGGESEEWHPPHWARLWPSGLVLAQELDGTDLGGRRVLELGCGLALPSLVAARAGARVLATDLSPAAVALAVVNGRGAGSTFDAAVADWATPDALLAAAPWDLVLGADVLYGHRAESLLRDLLPLLVGDTGTVLLADPGREPAGRFVAAAGRWSVTSRAAGDGIALHHLRPRGGPAR